MAIRTRRPGEKWPPSRNQRKADQHWDIAGLARKDGDKKEEERNTNLAREYQKKAAEEVETGN